MDEENCHFVYKHLWSPPESPLGQSQESPGSWNRIHSAWERLGSWGPGAVEGAAESIQHLDGDPVCLLGERPLPRCRSSVCGQQIIMGQYKAFTWLSWGIVTVLYQFTCERGQIRKCCENVGVRIFSIALWCEPCHLQSDASFFPSLPLQWREHVRDKRFMRRSGILKTLITFLLVLRGHIASPPEADKAQVFAEEVTSLFHRPWAFFSSQDLCLERVSDPL